MSGFLLPVCSFFFATLLVVFYFFKERINLFENKIFSYMIIISLIDSFLVSVLQILSVDVLSATTIAIINKIDFILLITYNAGMFAYIYLITTNKTSKKDIRKLFTYLIPITAILCIGCIVTNVDIIIDNQNRVSVAGYSPYILFGACAIFLFMSLIVVLKNYKNISKKHFPLFAYILLAIGLLGIYILDPYMIVISITLTFINFIMVFTIENPDMKMVSQLNVAVLEAKKANEAKSDFLSSMSHEIRTPLNAIVGLSEDMLESDKLDESLKEDATDVVSASKTLLEIVGNIIDISKIESQKIEVINTEYNFEEILKDTIKMNSFRIEGKDIEVTTDIAVDFPHELYGDKNHVKQIVNNVVSNAYKYTEKGKININARCINKNDTSLIVFSVEDTGRGIKKEHVDRLFNKFDRLDVAKNTTTEGTGLGLAITKQLVELLGGKINIQSNFGYGSLFVVQIPQKISKMNKPAEVEMLDVKVDSNLAGKKVLVVDDNLLNIKVARRALTPLGLEITEVTSGEEAINKVKENKYDVILMDIMMPGISGEETYIRLKEDVNFNTPVIALTADAISGAKNKYIKLGFSDYVAKPFSKDQIKTVLERIIK